MSLVNRKCWAREKGAGDKRIHLTNWSAIMYQRVWWGVEGEMESKDRFYPGSSADYYLRQSPDLPLFHSGLYPLPVFIPFIV